MWRKSFVTRFLAASVFFLAAALASCTHSPGVAPVAPDAPSGDEERFHFAMAAIREGRTADGLSMLDALRNEALAPWAARASFVLGARAVEGGGEGALAYMDGASGLEAIKDYVLLYRSRAQAAGGMHEEALSSLGSIISDHPDSAARAEALYRKGAVLLDAGRASEAAEALREFTAAHPGSALAPEAHIILARASIASGDNGGAEAAARRVLVRHPADPAAATAAAMATVLRAEGVKVEPLSAGERMERADNLFDAAMYDEAIDEYARAAVSKDPAHSDRALVRRSIALFRQKRYGDAERAIKEYLGGKNIKREAEALYWLAFTGLRLGSEETVKEAEGRLAKKYPSSDERAQALLFLGRHYNGRGDWARASMQFNLVIEKFSGLDAADEALWAIGWRAYRTGEYQQAREVFSSYGRLRPGGKEASRFAYWGARSALNSGDADAAGAAYGRLCAAEADYYCHMAVERGLYPRPEAERTAAGRAEGPSAVEEDARYATALELLTLGMRDYAVAETDALLRRHSGDRASAFALASMYAGAGDFHRALRLYYRRLGGGPGEPGYEFAYPLGLVGEIRRAAPEARDPFLVAAVMREESAFNPRVVSSAGAVGLMQVMPSTGRLVSERLGMGSFERNDLLDPATNIRLGAWYLEHLSGRFGGDVVLTIAAYNAGPGAASSWAGSLPADTDEFIESIPFQETRNYTKKVLRSYIEFLLAAGQDTGQRVMRPDEAKSASAGGSPLRD